MKINGNQVRKGHLLQYEGDLWRVHKTEATQPGKGGAYNQVEMKSITSGTKKNVRFRASETVERARLDEVDCTYLYMEGDDAVVMDTQTYEQTNIPADVLGDDAVFLDDGMTVQISFFEGKPLGIALPQHVTLSVVETEPVVKGQTASSSYKPATLSNGIRVGVPPFISADDQIVVDTVERSYVRRAE